MLTIWMTGDSTNKYIDLFKLKFESPSIASISQIYI